MHVHCRLALVSEFDFYRHIHTHPHTFIPSHPHTHIHTIIPSHLHTPFTPFTPFTLSHLHTHPHIPHTLTLHSEELRLESEQLMRELREARRQKDEEDRDTAKKEAGKQKKYWKLESWLAIRCQCLSDCVKTLVNFIVTQTQ